MNDIDVRYASLISLLLLVTPLLPLARARAQAIGDRPVLNADGSPDYATQGRYDFSGDQTGISLGPLVLNPSASATTAYDSNVFASPGPRREAALAITQALLDVTNQPGGIWDLEGEAFARQRRFTAASNQNTNEYGGSLRFDADEGSNDEVEGSVLAQRRFEARTDIETPDISQVSLYDQWLGTFSYIHTYNRLQMNYTVLAQQFDYLDASQRYRDRAFYEGDATATYQLPNTVSVLGTVFHSEDDYRFDNPAVAGGETTGVRTGAHVSIPEIAEFELTGGYFRREFAEHLGEISGLTVTGSMILYPTRLTTIRADVSRQDQPTRIPGAYGKVRTDGLLEIGHSYSERLNLYARARVVADDFATLHRTDMTYLGEIGAFYEVSRGIVLGLEYDVSERSSAVPAENFVQHLVSLSLIGRL